VVVRTLLVRGMLAGLLAGLVAFLYARYFAEPLIEQAIAFEDHRHELAGGHPDPELVSRVVQSTYGLLTGVVVYSTAIGGIFALVFAFAQGRLGRMRPRSTAALLAAAAFIVLFLVPQIKYPANPPSIGDPDTIGTRTALYFAMIAWSLASAVGALLLEQRLARRLDRWNAVLCGAGVYILAATLAMVILPSVNEVPGDFPAPLLWQFRMVSLGGHAVLLAVLGLAFGVLTERQMPAVRRSARRLQRSG
jgi:predicted cobalt transporter CbtA